METIAQYTFFYYTAYYVIVMIWYFFDPKPLKQAMKYSTIGLFVVMIVLVIALWIDGTLFKDIQVINYF